MKRSTHNMTAGNRAARGVALLVVLILVAVASVMGLSYLYSATLTTAGMENLLQARRADYVAASGLEHALYVLQAGGGAVAGTTWGPYGLDESDDNYSFSISQEDDETPGLFRVSSTGVSGNLERTRTMSVLVRASGHIELPHVLFVGQAGTNVSDSVNLIGNVHCNGNVYVLGSIEGNVSATGWIHRGWGGSITGSRYPYVHAMEAPSVSYDDYLEYVWYEDPYRDGPTIRGQAVREETGSISQSSSLNEGGSITTDNPGGVVELVPSSGDGVRILSGVEFLGTLVIDGDIVLAGSDITLQAQSGYPAIVASGRAVVDGDAEVEIKGLVVAEGGIVACDNDGADAEVKIVGGVLTGHRGISGGLEGMLEVEYEPARCRIFDFSNRSLRVVSSD